MWAQNERRDLSATTVKALGLGEDAKSVESSRAWRQQGLTARARQRCVDEKYGRRDAVALA